ncbi:hypothetical protein BD410DRAFT_790922 [Rickenella mellea]|uniref:F-box domain-containing protein n=1 Tax=Rickenella mellea TaxID=50990 RepID=A0A4Y7PYG3_9AGAM|nr:hypothetical protein BD410DRAFT_790922 [Rickenella mellea]
MVTTRQATGNLPPPKRVESDRYTTGEGKRRNNVAKTRKKRVQETTKSDDDLRDVPVKSESNDSIESEDHDARDGNAKRFPHRSREIRSIWYSGRVDKAVVGEKSKANRITLKSSVLHAKKLPAGKKGRDHGKLALLMTMPIDIFCEIASHMAPLDILNLSRTTASLRSLLMSKRSRHIWRAAQHNVCLPECPPDICEPQYAKLVFERLCHVCGAPRTQKADFAMRVRLCKGCMSLNAGQGFTFTKPYGKEVMRDTRIYKLVPFYQSAAQSARNAPIKEDYLKFQRFYKPDFEEALEQYLMLASDSIAQDKFVAERVMLVEQIVKHAVEIDKWMNGVSWEKSVGKREILIRRENSIVAKLMELGYTKMEVMKLGDEYDPIFEHPRDLTERIWAGIRPKLEAGLLLNRRKELEREEKKRLYLRQEELSVFYHAHIQNLQVSDDERIFLPAAGDFYSDPSIAAVLNPEYCSTEFTEERWDSLLPTLPDVFMRHRSHIVSTCASLLSEARQFEGIQEQQPPVGETCTADKEDVLRLATSFFTYDWDFHSPRNSLLAFPALVDHPQVRGREDWLKEHEWIHWGTDLLCKGYILRIASILLANLGLPNSTTMEHMEALGRCLVCKRCDPVFLKKMSWAELVDHFGCELDWYETAQFANDDLETSIPTVNDHDLHSDDLCALTGVPIEDHLKNVNEEPAGGPQNLALEEERLHCRFCDVLQIFNPSEPYSRLQVETHVRVKHGVEPKPQDIITRPAISFSYYF